MINFASANKKIVKLEARTLEIPVEQYRGVEQLVARQAHNLEVAGSSPVSATECRVSVSETVREALQGLYVRPR